MGESADITARDARTAAEINPDVGAEHIGEIYAKALLGAAGPSGQVAGALEELDAIIDDVFRQFPKLETVLGSPLISHEERSGTLDRVFGSRLSALVLHFLKVVSRHGRLDCLRAIRSQAHRLQEQAQGRVRVRFSTAASLDKAQIDQITEKLRATLGGDPILEPVVDPALIGGAVLRVGDTVYDGSIANQLQMVRQKMIDRSVHEIQSRRDRFRNPAGS